MEQLELRVAHREILGKKVRFLRRQGVIPLHVFGHGIEPLALQCDAAQLRDILAKAGKTRLVNLKIAKATKPRNVVVREVQRDPRTGALIHVDLYQVRMEEEIKVEVPIVLVGEALALKSKGAMLVHEMDSLTIQCLPDKIPARIEVNLGLLTETDQALHVKDIVLGEGVKVVDDLDRIVVKIGLLAAEKVEEKVAPEEVTEVPVVTKAAGEEPEGES